MDLIKRHGNKMVLLDATYKTTRYALLLFFMVLKTNVDYQIVASFVIKNETYEAILEAVVVIKSWNPEFDPKYAMTDYCHEEIRALENNFPSTVAKIFFSFFLLPQKSNFYKTFFVHVI